MAISDFHQDAGNIWSGIDGLRRPIHDALLAPTNDAIRSMFLNPISCDLFYGVDNIAKSIEPSLAENANIDVELSDQAGSQIVDLAHALGVRRWVPEGAEHLHSYNETAFVEPSPNIEDILGRIEQKLGFPIAFPTPFAGERGLATQRGL